MKNYTGKVPKQLLTMNELAVFVGRHPARMRKYYAEGILPEPENRIEHDTRIMRRFTLAEAERLRYFFDHLEYGTLAKARRREVTRRIRKNA